MASTNAGIWYAFSFLLLIQSSIADTSASFAQYHKSKVASPAIDFLQNLTIPVPSFAFNATGRQYDEDDIYQLEQYIAATKYWIQALEQYEITDADLMNETDLICTTNPDTDITNNDTCVDGSYVLPSQYIFHDLTYNLPHDACDFDDTVCQAWITSVLEPVNKTGKVYEQLRWQSTIAEQNQTRSYYRLIGDYIGVGFSINDTCRANINMALGSLDKFNEAGWAAATTLTALIPALLTIGNLYVPRSSEVFATSFLVGIMSAMFSLGLPVRGISGVPTDQQADTVSFSYKARVWLVRLGRISNKAFGGARHSAEEAFDLKTLQKWSAHYDEMDLDNLTNEQEMTDAAFSKIRQRTKEWRKRAHAWQIPSFFVASSQVVLFVVAVSPLFLSYGTPLLLFDCKNYWTSAWLLIAAGISAVFRFIMWEKGSHERVKMYDLSDFAVETMRDYAGNTLKRSDGTHYAHVETDLPPLHPPLLNAMGQTIHEAWNWICKVVTRKGHSNKQSNVPLREKPVGFFEATFAFVRLLWDDLVNALKYPRVFLMGGFKAQSAPEAARRWRPLIVLMHLSTAGRNPVATLFTGLIEGFVLILLTAFFAAQWGGNLFVMCYITAILLVAISAGRALGLFYVIHSTKSFGLHVIENQDYREVRGCLRLLCSMREILVHVNGAWFFEGHRLDVRPGWLEFQRCYNLGHLDSKADQISKCSCRHFALSSSPSVVQTTGINSGNPTLAANNKPLPAISARPQTAGSGYTNMSRVSSHGAHSIPDPSAGGANNSAMQLLPLNNVNTSNTSNTSTSTSNVQAPMPAPASPAIDVAQTTNSPALPQSSVSPPSPQSQSQPQPRPSAPARRRTEPQNQRTSHIAFSQRTP